VLGVLALCAAGKVELVSSEALEYETEQNPWPARQEHAKAVLAQARMRATIDEAVETRALRKAQQLHGLQVRVVSPVDLIKELG